MTTEQENSPYDFDPTAHKQEIFLEAFEALYGKAFTNKNRWSIEKLRKHWFPILDEVNFNELEYALKFFNDIRTDTNPPMPAELRKLCMEHRRNLRSGIEDSGKPLEPFPPLSESSFQEMVKARALFGRPPPDRSEFRFVGEEVG